MSKLKISSIPDDKPVRFKIDLPAAVHRDLIAYAEILGRETGCSVEPVKLIAPMLVRFMASAGLSCERAAQARSVLNRTKVDAIYNRPERSCAGDQGPTPEMQVL